MLKNRIIHIVHENLVHENLIFSYVLFNCFFVSRCLNVYVLIFFNKALRKIEFGDERKE